MTSHHPWQPYQVDTENQAYGICPWSEIIEKMSARVSVGINSLQKHGNPEVLTHRYIYIYILLWLLLLLLLYSMYLLCIFVQGVSHWYIWLCLKKSNHLNEKKFLMILSSPHWPDPHLRTRNFTHLRTLTHLRTQWAKCHSLAHPHHLSFWKKPLQFHHCWLWGAVGWGGTITLMFLLTQAPQPHHLSCSRTDTGIALSWSVTGGVGWGGTITLMFLCTHRHRNLIIFLAVLQTQALLFHDQIPVGWGGTITFMFLCTHTMMMMMMMIPMIMIMIFMGVQAREIVGVQAS